MLVKQYVIRTKQVPLADQLETLKRYGADSSDSGARTTFVARLVEADVRWLRSQDWVRSVAAVEDLA